MKQITGIIVLVWFIGIAFMWLMDEVDFPCPAWLDEWFPYLFAWYTFPAAIAASYLVLSAMEVVWRLM